MNIDRYKNEVIEKYKKNTTLLDLGNEYGCNPETVMRRIVEWGVKPRKRGEYFIGLKKSPEHSEKLRKNLDRMRNLAVEASKKAWIKEDGTRMTRKEFDNKNRDHCGEKNPRWRGGVSSHYFKQIVISKFGRVCQKCGYKEHPEIIEVHHIDGNHHNNNIDNGITVCPNCHRILEFEAKTFHTKLRKKRYA